MEKLIPQPESKNGHDKKFLLFHYWPRSIKLLILQFISCLFCLWFHYISFFFFFSSSSSSSITF